MYVYDSANNAVSIKLDTIENIITKKEYDKDVIDRGIRHECIIVLWEWYANVYYVCRLNGVPR